MCSKSKDLAIGDPIYPLTGRKRQVESLGNWKLSGQSLEAIFDSRYYLPSSNPNATTNRVATPSFGAAWSSSFHKNLNFKYDFNGVLQSIQLYNGAIGWVSFLPAPGSRFVPADQSFNGRLAVSGNGLVYTDPDKDRSDMEKRLLKVAGAIGELQWTLYAEKKQSLLVVFQALDAAGKDGVIRHVLSDVSPQGVSTVSFKQPTSIEKDRDFLWRVHLHTPARGEFTIFNRSHYEDVLVARVHELVPPAVWKKRFDFINQFEHLLSQECNTRILKFYLHMSPEVQLERFHDRLSDEAKNWKITESDYKEREHWPAYIDAFEETLTRTSTEHAPWFVIPADDKAVRNLLVAEVIRENLSDMNPAFPLPSADLDQVRALYEAAKRQAKAVGKNLV
jgi:PPK2 family polyphosphate:nucleotide phosphotransferase